MPIAIPYVRFSASHQEKGSSVERQEELIDIWLIKNPDYDRFNRTFRDLGRSGYKGEHLDHGMGKILAAIQDGVIKSGDVILVEAIDRVGRLATVDMLDLITGIVSSGVSIITLQGEEQIYNKERLNTDSSCIYILLGQIQQAHNYSKSLSARLEKAWESKRKLAAKGGDVSMQSPYWLTSDGKLIPERAKIIKECIDLYLKGRGHRAILLELVDKYPELSKVHPSTLKRWFKHRALIGEWEHTRAKDQSLSAIPDVFEPLIDKNTFYKLQTISKQRTKVMGPEQTYELSGLVVCNECGSPYHFRRQKHKDDVIVYANCSAYLKRGAVKCTNGKSWPYEVLMQILEDTAFDHLANVMMGKKANEDTEYLNVLSSELEEINREVDKLISLTVKFPEQENIENMLSQAISKKDKKMAEIKEQEGTLTSEGIASFDPDYFNDAMEDIDVIHQRSLLQSSGYRIKGTSTEMLFVLDEAGTISYRLHKRSQKYKCYLVEQDLSNYKEFNSETHNYEPYQYKSIKFAVNRSDGLVAATKLGDWDDLLEMLANPDQAICSSHNGGRVTQYFETQPESWDFTEVVEGVTRWGKFR